ncbi:MAG: hypothetical protein H0V43_02995 [Gemmatimonadales bacterium]|nr:hypothetical protein [Gemmatimonadales bacterium]MBA3553672.1 hypothetical protein [Gemmatimonadales bacterium]
MVRARPDRRGSSTLGCIFSLALFVAALYYGLHIGQVYVRYYRLLDVMRFQASIAPSVSDDVIGRRLRATADSLLGQSPPFRISRGGRPHRITIQTEYQERVDLPLFHHTFDFRPRAEGGR